MKSRIVLFTTLLFLQNALLMASDYQVTSFPLTRNDLELNLQRLTVPGKTESRPLLLVHGLTYSSHEFDINYDDYSLARYFAREGYAVWMLDIAGYGKSQKPEDGFITNSDYAAEDIAEAARLILKESGTEDLDVLGWSWGTVTTSKFAAKYPDMVRSLVLYAPILAGLGEAEVNAPYQATNWEHAADDFQKTSKGEIDYDILDPVVAAMYLSNCWRYDGNGSPNGGRRELLVPREERLINPRSLKCPVLLVTGDRDPYVDLDLCEETVSMLPSGSELFIIEGGAHAMMMEKDVYTQFREIVLDFLHSIVVEVKKAA